MIKDRSYKISFACAITLHLLLMILLCIKFAPNIEQPALQPNVNIVKAFSISQNTVDQYFAQVNAEKQQVQQAAEQARLQQQMQKQQQQQQIEQKMAEAQKEKLEQQLKQQMIAEQAKEAQIIKKQQKQLEEQQKATTKKQEQKKLQDALQKQLAKEAELLKKQAKVVESSDSKSVTAKSDNKSNNTNSSKSSTAASSGEIDKYKALIIQAISQEWIVPDGVDKDATCKILVKVAPGGVVLSADIIQGSGNELLDHSAQTAVLKASPLPVPKDSALFDSFRAIQLTVHPQEIVSG